MRRVPTSKEHKYVHTYKQITHTCQYMHSIIVKSYIYYKLLQCRCLHFIETRIQILHYSSRKQVHSIILTNLNANCSSLVCSYYIDNMYIGNFRYTFSPNHNVHKSLCGLCFWAPDHLIDSKIYRRVWSPKTKAARTFMNVAI